MSLRTPATVKAEYDAVHASYLRSLDQTQASHSTGGGSGSFTRDNPTSLLAQLRALSAEYEQLTGGGIIIVQGVPDD